MPRKTTRPPGALQDAELIPLADLLAELSRAIGAIPAQAAIREAWLSDTDTDAVTFIGKKLIFANARAALSEDMRFLVRTEHVLIPPATLVRQELLGITLNQLADSKRATLTTTGDLLDARGRLFVYALRSDAARRWPGIIALLPAIEAGAPAPMRRRKPAPKMPETRPEDAGPEDAGPEDAGPKVWAAVRIVVQIDPDGTAYPDNDALLVAVREHMTVSRRTLAEALAWLRKWKLR